MPSKALTFYGRFLPSFTRIGYVARGLPLRPPAGSLAGQTWLVTGATGGIGRAVAMRAARHGARVMAAGRDPAKLAMLARASERIEPVQRDLSRVSENLGLAEECGSIDVLINNVGVLATAYDTTAEGFETSYATSLLGHFALTEALIDAGKLDRAAIVNVTSGGLYNAPLDTALLNLDRGAYNGFLAYAANKRAQLALADHWAGRMGCAYAMHPGWVATAGVSDALPWMDRWLGPLLRSPDQGADTAIWLASKRPAPRPDRVWFDRAARTAHHYAHTKNARSGIDDLLAKLQADVARAKDGE
ncbi:SDR family NAD(P)-dependent oxidoreductase [Pelagerythrobacter marinus]|uniref:SDR family NAD(P)-dependent oxidoreductase n=1 Tax=Pelagerythrobacter marinus TaxID=538382 RepID=UPI0020367E6E|nr:SDR family NAD(P)-dependent oxidoreductase [Pelagerythrobacter marinus]USA39448.1 SDR family NAD(P)-dependent oxidoreductase [Pelagerythrobacter marinus]WPZ06412.1 SDR family NAD(P)-dependent oxidoreductase [Pelagerythrobacter marinus]